MQIKDGLQGKGAAGGRGAGVVVGRGGDGGVVTSWIQTVKVIHPCQSPSLYFNLLSSLFSLEVLLVLHAGPDPVFFLQCLLCACPDPPPSPSCLFANDVTDNLASQAQPALNKGIIVSSSFSWFAPFISSRRGHYMGVGGGGVLRYFPLQYLASPLSNAKGTHQLTSLSWWIHSVRATVDCPSLPGFPSCCWFRAVFSPSPEDKRTINRSMLTVQQPGTGCTWRHLPLVLRTAGFSESFRSMFSEL